MVNPKVRRMVDSLDSPVKIHHGIHPIQGSPNFNAHAVIQGIRPIHLLFHYFGLSASPLAAKTQEIQL